MFISSLEYISPEIARNIINTSKNMGFINRQERLSTIKKYAKKMQDGEWVQTGDTIKITSDGVLIDGYHRLYAIIESGVTIPLLVVRGINKSSYSEIDTGQKRNYYDVLYIDGYRKYTKYITAAAKVIIHFIKHKSYPDSNLTYIGINDIRKVCDQYHETMEIAAQYYASRQKGLINASVNISLWTMFSTIDEQKTYDFFDKIYTGVNLDDNDPRYHVRKMELTYKFGGKTKLKPHHEAACIITAWNSFIQNKSMKVLRYTPQNGFPVIVKFNYENFL